MRSLFIIACKSFYFCLPALLLLLWLEAPMLFLGYAFLSFLVVFCFCIEIAGNPQFILEFIDKARKTYVTLPNAYNNIKRSQRHTYLAVSIGLLSVFVCAYTGTIAVSEAVWLSVVVTWHELPFFIAQRRFLKAADSAMGPASSRDWQK